ncbi:MAG: ABC transporter ATP-binding protein [Dehalococcoidales bacterium]|jgi:putative ABC transport system ATP-binding protein
MNKEADNTPLISLQKASKSYTEGLTVHPVLVSIDADFEKGECVALLGRSGSGKSTMLNVISGIDKLDNGKIIIDGIDITNLSEQKRTLFRRKNIGFVFQFFNLIPTLTVLENILLPLELNGMDNKESAMELLNEVGLFDRKNDYPDKLSGGEQQRIAIIRALVHDPLVILADEPTGNVDKDTGQNILNIMDRLIRKRNKNLIMVTHSKEVAKFADRLLLLEEGKLKKHSKEVAW